MGHVGFMAYKGVSNLLIRLTRIMDELWSYPEYVFIKFVGKIVIIMQFHFIFISFYTFKEGCPSTN